MSTGAFTVTLNIACDPLPLVSDAEQVTVVIPTGNVEPDGGAHVTVRVPSTASIAVGPAYVTTAPPGPEAVTVTSAGTFENTGPVVSCTVTLNDFDDALLLASC